MRMSSLEKELLEKGYEIVGIDECGRGCCFGDLFIGYFVLKPDTKLLEGVNDSKKLTKKKRENLTPDICTGEHEILSNFPSDGLNESYEDIIETIEHRFKERNVCYLVDAGIKRFYKNMFNKPIFEFVKGDSKHYSIACASIITKQCRDQNMNNLAKNGQYGRYNIAKNKGYCSKDHMDAVKKYGVSDLHRTCYKNLLPYIK